MFLAKWISFSIYLCFWLLQPAFSEVYVCQKNKQQARFFTDNRFDCHQGQADILTVKPQIARVERKVLAITSDLSQRDPNADFPAEGRKFCAPVAVSNSLSSAMGGLANSQQIELAKTLGSEEYMATGHKGTNPRQLLQGVEHYLEMNKRALLSFGKGQLEYQGRYSVPRKYNQNLNKTAELPWLISGIKQEKHIWLNIGWYQTQANGKKKRMGGHWVTLVGYEKLGSLKDSQGEYLIVNDPATRGGDSQEQLAVKVATLNGRFGYQLLNQDSMPTNADVAWIEGAIQLAL